MKKITAITFLSLILLTLKSKSQVLNDYTKGSITLLDGTMLEGLIKNTVETKGFIKFFDSTNNNKKTYYGTDLLSITINDVMYRCIHGDFFKVLCKGDIFFLQKASKTSNKIIYAGGEPIGVAGTEGKKGDYFIFKNNLLTLLNKKTLTTVLSKELATCPAALEKIDKEYVSNNTVSIQEYNNCK